MIGKQKIFPAVILGILTSYSKKNDRLLHMYSANYGSKFARCTNFYFSFNALRKAIMQVLHKVCNDNHNACIQKL